MCHGINRAGSPPSIPALRGIEGILTDQEIAATIRQGKGRMPPFNGLSDEEVESIVHYLTRAPQQQQRRPCRRDNLRRQRSLTRKNDMPYKTIGFRRFLDPGRLSGNRAAMGSLSAIDHEYRKVSVEDSIRRIPGAGG